MVKTVNNDLVASFALISSQPHAAGVPFVTQLLSVNSNTGAVFVHWSHKANADALLAATMLNAKIAAKAIPIM
jgi:hypothetical protein